MREKSVLIIDDEKRMADSLRDLLQGCGYKSQVAYGGREGLDRLKRESFNVVVTDLRMSGVDGLEVIHYVHEHYPHTLVIVITGHATTESAIEAVHYQVFDYLPKPFSFDLFRMAIEKAFQKIETEQLREDTAAMITHDIKIPLTSIIGFAAMIYDRSRGQLHPRARQFAETIQANGQKVLMLIENYLTSCEIEAGTLKVVPETLDIRQLLADAIDTVAIDLARHDQEIIREIDDRCDTARVNGALVYRAVGNLLQNAIKYSEGHGAIRVRLYLLDPSPSRSGGKRLVIEVINQAQGLGAEELEGIFQRFKRSPKRPGIGGTGIGLYVVEAVAQAHGGQVEAEMAENGQVRFAMTLPLSASLEGDGA